MSDSMRFLLFTAIPVAQDVLLAALLVRGLVLQNARKADMNAGLVSLSPLLLWGSFIPVCILSLPVTLFCPEDMSPGVWYLFEVMILAEIIMMLAFCNETVTYDNESFTRSNLFGVKRTYDYSEITGLSRRGGDTILRCGRQRIRLDAIAYGSGDFIIFADKAYLRRFGRGIPIVKSRWDPMNGNLDTPWLYLFLYVFLLMASVVMIILAVSGLRPVNDQTPADVVQLRTSFQSWERVKKECGTLILHAEGYEKPFTLSWLSGFEVPVPEPEALCSGADYILMVREGEEDYQIYALSTDKHRPIITALDHNTAYRNTQFSACIFLVIAGVLCFVFSVFGIVVGRHPDRFSPWVRGWFYKPAAWTSPTGEYARASARRRPGK